MNPFEEEMKESLDQNDPVSLYEEGVLYEEGRERKRDLNLALFYYQKSALLGDTKAQLRIAMLYQKSLFGKPNRIKALPWLVLAAKRGDTEAQYQLGLCYENGDLTDKDEKKALYWYRKASENHHVSALRKVAEFYMDGKSYMVPNEKKGVWYYHMAADLGDVDSMLALGYCYLQARGVKLRLSKALEWFNLASDYGSDEAEDMIYLLTQQNKKPRSLNQAIFAS